MKQWKKVISVLVAFVFLFGAIGNPASAAVNLNKNNHDVMTEEQFELAKAMMSNLNSYTDADGNPQLEIINKNELKLQMDSISSNLMSFTELEDTISQFNFYIAQGDNALTDLADEVIHELEGNQLMALNCSDILSIIGLIHSGNLALAAFLLGVTGPAAFLVPFLVAAAYTAGSVLGCKL